MSPQESDAGSDVFRFRESDEPNQAAADLYQVIGPGVICDTEARGHASPQGQRQLVHADKRLEILLDASEGFIPLWMKGSILRWRFQERAMTSFANPEVAKQEIRQLFSEAILAWGVAVPVKFTYDEDVWDFEIVVKRNDACNTLGCVLASAFFPDAGRHEFVIYPKMFTQSRKEQVDTFIHESGHIFGLRHFFAKIKETDAPSELFGEQNKFSIMNYGDWSELTSADKNDLQELYRLAWSGALTQINGTPIRLVKPFNTLAPTLSDTFAFKPA